MRRELEVVDVSIPDLSELLDDELGGHFVLIHDFKPDIDTYLANRPTAPIRSLDEIIASQKFHPAIAPQLHAHHITHSLWRVLLTEPSCLNALGSRLQSYQALIQNGVDALVYPSILKIAQPLGEEQLGSNCKLSARSGLPAITVPAGFTSNGLPVGLRNPWAGMGRVKTPRVRLCLRASHPSPSSTREHSRIVRVVVRQTPQVGLAQRNPTSHCKTSEAILDAIL